MVYGYMGGMKVDEREKEFNLLDEPWILVKTKTNETKKWSILEIFQHAHEAQALAGELPTQDFAIMRLLLAIMHATIIDSNIEDKDDAIECWVKLWEMKRFPFDFIRDYLEQYRERFWLFHPTQPFYQSANIVQNMKKFKADKGKAATDGVKSKTVARLVGDLFQSDNLPRLFPGRTGNSQLALSYDEAARWLIHLNGFDDDSAKNPTPKNVGYLGQLGLVYLKGRNIFETLMLNFVLVNHLDEIFDDCQNDSKAYWEKPVCEKIERLIAQPRAQKDLLTMQSRRILLQRENGMVTGYLLTMGDYFDKEASLINEMMTMWKTDEKKGIVPKRHRLDCQIWRDFSALMGMAECKDDIKPGVVNWLHLVNKKRVFDTKIFKLAVTGGYYNLKGAGWQIVDYIYDDLSINASLINAMNNIWIQEIIAALSKTDRAIFELGKLSTNIAEASGDSDKNRKPRLAQTAREKSYHQLDGVFRQWLLSVDPKQDILEEKMAEWLGIAKNTILRLGDEMLRQCPEQAIVGRIKKDGEKIERRINAIEACNIFKYKVNMILG